MYGPIIYKTKHNCKNMKKKNKLHDLYHDDAIYHTYKHTMRTCKYKNNLCI